MCRRFDAPQLGKATPDDATGQPRTDGEVVEDGPTRRRAGGESCSLHSLHRPMRQAASVHCGQVAGHASQDSRVSSLMLDIRIYILRNGKTLRALHRSRSSHAQLPEGLDRTCAGLGITVASPVSTARAAASASTVSDLPRRRRCLAVGPVHLDDLHTASAQIAGEPRSPRAAALDAHRHELTEAAQPCEQTAVAAAGCRELCCSDDAAEIIDHRSNVHLLVGIDTAKNAAPDARPRDGGHATPSSSETKGMARTAGRADRTVIGPSHRRLFGHVRPTGACDVQLAHPAD
jgi:hypothetical protein